MTSKKKDDTWALVMMAGKGTRMKSDLPKVLHPIIDYPMAGWVLASCETAGIKNRVMVVGHQAEMVVSSFPAEKYVLQEPQNGTGHAVMTGLKGVPKSAGTLLVLSGDVPCLVPDVISGLLKAHGDSEAAATVLSFYPPDPTGYGRIVRDDDGGFVTIKEHKDLGKDEIEIEECNSGIYVFDCALLRKQIRKITPSKRSGEYHLPDVLTLIMNSGSSVHAVAVEEWMMAMGVNTRLELSEASDYMRWMIAENHMMNGVTIMDPASTWIGPGVKIAKDVTILPGSIILGESRIGSGSIIGPYTEVRSTKIGKNAVLRHSVITDSQVDNDVTVGPFAHIRPGTRLRKGSHVGNFVEMKKTDFGEGSKSGHLTYLGDSKIGKNVNVGAGTITCNYDGKKKHQTIIGDGVFVGSNTIIVAPLKIGKDAYTAAGSTLNKDVPPRSLAFGRAHQHVKKGWVVKKKEDKE